MSIIEELCLWFNEKESSLISVNLNPALVKSPADGNTRAVWLDLDSAHRVGRLILWETGAAELSVGEVRTGEIVVEEHREITSIVGLTDAVESLIAWVR